MRLKMAAAIATSALALALIGCGGGGGGTGSGETITASPPPPPPPPPAPANTAPVVNYTISSTSPDEGQPFWIDASGSVDVDGDSLTFSVTQKSGPQVSDVPIYESVPTGEAIFAFRAPEVDASAVMEFEIYVFDGMDIGIETVAVTATNIVMEPSIDILGEVLGEFEGLRNPVATGFYSSSFQQPEAGIIGVEDTDDGNGMTLFRYINDTLTEAFGAKILLSFENSVAGDLVDVEGIIPSIFGAPYFPAFALERSGKVFITTADASFVPGSDAENELAVTDVLDVPGACSVNDVSSGDTEYDLIVGTRGDGLRLYLQKPANGTVLSLTYEPGQVLADEGELCILSDGNGETIAAFDSSANVIRTWKRDPVDFVEQETIPVEFPLDAPILVTAKISSPSNGKVKGAFLFTDGHHEGHHYLKLYYDRYDGTGPIQTKTYFWSKGVPSDVTDMLVLTVTDHYYPGYFVTLETAPYVAYIQDNGNSQSIGAEPDFSPMTYAPAPMWSSSIQSAVSTDLDRGALVFTRNKASSVTMTELIPQP